MDIKDVATLLGAVMPMVSSLGAVVLALIALRRAGSTMRKEDGDAALSITSAAADLVNPLRDQINELRGQLKVQSGEIGELRRQIVQRDSQIQDMQQLQRQHEDGIRRLAGQVVSLGGKPVYELPGQSAANLKT